MAVAAAAGPSISYWVITPEMDTDAVVHSIRHSWMLDAGAHAHFAVATGLSQSRDPSLHWLSGLNNSLVPFVAASRSDLNARLYQTVAPSMPNQSAHAYLLDQASSAGSSPQPSQQQQVRVKQQVDKAWRITRQYNSFLRHKVFEIMREMCRSVRREHAFDYAFLMDADTAVNRTNLEAFVRPLPAKDSVYTGFCKRRWSAGNKHVLRGVGGGPGILLSRPLLLRTCPALEHCAPLRTLMNKLDRAGGDLMLAKCMEFLGVRCQMGDELGHAGDLGDLFRRGPPWVYPPLPPGTILVASKGSNGARASPHAARGEPTPKAPDAMTIASTLARPRCQVRARSFAHSARRAWRRIASSRTTASSRPAPGPCGATGAAASSPSTSGASRAPPTGACCPSSLRSLR